VRSVVLARQVPSGAIDVFADRLDRAFFALGPGGFAHRAHEALLSTYDEIVTARSAKP
jgi:hypothetical protein